jgi:hypothetical protein
MHEYSSRFKPQISDFGRSILDTPVVLSAVMPYLLFGEDSPRHGQWREGKQNSAAQTECSPTPGNGTDLAPRIRADRAALCPCPVQSVRPGHGVSKTRTCSLRTTLLKDCWRRYRSFQVCMKLRLSINIIAVSCSQHADDAPKTVPSCPGVPRSITN